MNLTIGLTSVLNNGSYMCFFSGNFMVFFSVCTGFVNAEENCMFSRILLQLVQGEHGFAGTMTNGNC